MLMAVSLCFFLAGPSAAQDPFGPLKLDGAIGIPSRASARADWVKLTNQRMEMSGKALRVAQGDGGLTAVVRVPGVEKPRHAKPILTGKGDYALLFKSIVAQGFQRIVVENPASGQTWGARLEQGKPILE
jgi:hypothetical protein